MREFKFRVFDNDYKRMHVVGEDTHDSIQFLYPKNQAYYYNYQNGESSLKDDEGNSTYELMQYTGLDDAKGNPIYEGDILKRTVSVYVLGSSTPPKDVDEYLQVEYRDEYAGFFIGETPLHYFVGAKYDIHTKCKCTDVEVIGNIFEDKHLLGVD